MIVLIGIGGEAYDYRIEKGRFTHSTALRYEVFADIELEFVATGLHRMTVKQGFVRAAVTIADGRGAQLAPAIQRIKPYIDMRCRPAVCRIKDMRGQASHCLPRTGDSVQLQQLIATCAKRAQAATVQNIPEPFLERGLAKR